VRRNAAEAESKENADQRFQGGGGRNPGIKNPVCENIKKVETEQRSGHRDQKLTKRRLVDKNGKRYAERTSNQKGHPRREARCKKLETKSQKTFPAQVGGAKRGRARCRFRIEPLAPDLEQETGGWGEVTISPESKISKKD